MNSLADYCRKNVQKMWAGVLQRRARRLSRLEVTSSLNKLFLVVSTLVGYSPLCLKLVDRLLLKALTGVYILLYPWWILWDFLQFSGSDKDDCHKLMRENSSGSNKRCESANWSDLWPWSNLESPSVVRRLWHNYCTHTVCAANIYSGVELLG